MKKRGDRVSFGEVFDKFAVGAIVAIATYVGSELRTISNSVSELNVNVAVALQKLSNQERAIDELKGRVSALEKK